MKIGLRAILLGWFLTALFSIISMYLELVVKNSFTVSDTLIPVLTYFFLIVCVLIINPLCRLFYAASSLGFLKPFNRHEVLLITMMTLVTSGISGYGLTNYLVPFIGTVNNPAYNKQQTEWGLVSQHVVSYKDKSDKKPDVFGDLVSEDNEKIVLKVYKPDAQEVTFLKSEVTLREPIFRPELVLNREDSEEFAKGLQSLEVVNKETGLKEFYQRNAFPVFMIFPNETFSEYKDRLLKTMDEGLPKGFTFWGNVPWEKVIKPFSYWLVLILSIFLMLFSLSRILFTQWAKYERLQFPLAVIPQAILGEEKREGEERQQTNLSLFSNQYFLVGLVIACVFILMAAWSNGGDFKLSLPIKDYMIDTIFEGLKDFKLVFNLFFICVGIAFMVPKEISFSVWFFGLVFIGQILFAIWFGFGKSAATFNTDYYMTVSFYSAIASGGVAVFSALALWNVRHYLFSGLYKYLPIRPKSVTDEMIEENYIASLIFIISSFGIVGFMYWMNISIYWIIVYSIITLFFIVAAMRVASECGIIGFQNIAASGNHFGANIFGIKALGIQSFVNVIIIQVIFFFDTKTFLGPNAMVAQKVEDEAQINRKKFWTTLFIAVVLAVVVSFLYNIALVYSLGANTLESWYYKDVPSQVFKTGVITLKSGAEDAFLQSNGTSTFFIIFGMAFMAALLLARTKWFWVPHPVGIILWISPHETKYILCSFFVGWLIKFLVVKFGTKDTIENMKKGALGLIFGHILAIIIIGMVKCFVDITFKATLNVH